VLLGELAGRDPLPDAVRAFAMKFQQVTAPVTAKGVEDTALYRMNRLVALNEVGGEPENFGVSVRAFHADAQHRARHWPHEMLGSSTHDTKRSEDVRARLTVLSEMPREWRVAITRWNRLNRLRKREVDGVRSPSRNDEYLLYQTLLGSWPLEELDDAGLEAYRERIAAYMLKAAREAKVHTSWSRPNERYEEALRGFVCSLLDRGEGQYFLGEFLPLQRRVAFFGMLNSLTQVLLKLTAPGVPDLYQGNELWDFSLVDPDNRRPVDWAHRSEALAGLREWESLGAGALAERMRGLLARPEDGRAKLYLTWRALELRCAREALFRHGDYVPLRTAGAHAAHLCAFARRLGQEVAIVVAPRLYLRLLGGEQRLPLGPQAWADTVVELPARLPELPLVSVLDGAGLERHTGGGRAYLHAAELFAHFPVALLAGAPDLQESPQ
jgi:(1->4)-alpha-D-glucan 1-alpha-D-glucosylmutase